MEQWKCKQCYTTDVNDCHSAKECSCPNEHEWFKIEVKKLSKEINDLFNERKILIDMNLQLSSDLRELNRSAQRVLNFYEIFRLKSLHLMDDKEIKESFDSIHELSEILTQ